MKPFAFRLTKGQELKSYLENYSRENNLSGSVFACAGCLQSAELRLAGAQETVILQGPLEIVSFMGTLCPDHIHIHVAVSDATGHTTGGHLVSAMVSYTAEVMGAQFSTYAFCTELDVSTGYKELVVRPQ